MVKNSDRVIVGFMRLTSSEQKEAIDAISEYVKGEIEKKKQLKIQVEKRAGLDLGPLGGGGCPCCGK
jgi:hypothetical protein